jgi:hypothetical protein
VVVGSGAARGERDRSGAGGRRERRRRDPNRCLQRAAHWKLKLSPDNGRIELEFQVDTNRVGRAWRVRIRHNGVLIFVGKRVTKAPSGAFTVRRLTNNRAGTDSFRAGAGAVVSGQTCVGRASIG